MDHNLLKGFILFTVMLVIILGSLYIKSSVRINDKSKVQCTFSFDHTDDRQELSDPICPAPNLTLDTDTLQNFYGKITQIRCRGNELFHVESSKLRINTDALDGMNLTECSYREIQWISDFKVGYGKPVVRKKDFEIELKHDFYRIQCSADSTKKGSKQNKAFTQLVAQIYRNNAALERISGIRPSPRSSQMNVLIYVLESMSHLGFKRRLPKTYAYLNDVLHAAIFNQYNIVADASMGAIIPLLTGHHKMEVLPARRIKYGSRNIDCFPFLWKKFSRSGYMTLYAEDRPDLYTFSMNLKGFKNMPVDHYMPPFWREALKETKKSKYCIGAKTIYDIHLAYIKDFFVKYDGVPKFAFGFLVGLTHDDQSTASNLDPHLVDFLDLMRTNGYLDNTLLIIMADHGPRYAAIRETYQGKLEERLPMLSITLPPSFRNIYPRLVKNLMRNQNRLTTPFDVHVTVESVLDIEEATKPANHTHRGISLLKEIPVNRTCDSAGIALHWCSCLKEEALNVTEPIAKTLAGFVVSSLNERIQIVNHLCVKLELQQIRKAVIVTPREQVVHHRYPFQGQKIIFKDNMDIVILYFQITLVTTPNDGLYEATVKLETGNYRLTIVGDISRINRYADQPHCIVNTHADLEKFCYCKQRLSKSD